MGKKISRKRIIIIGVIIAFALSFLLPMRFSPWARLTYFFMHYRTNQNQERLLCETNYEELLEACRVLMKDDEFMKPGMRYPVRGAKRHPRTSKFPQIILDLNPSVVCIGNAPEYIRLEMAGGITHFGVRAYPENFTKPFPNFEYGDKELIPGLWYYDDGNLENPEYNERIEALIRKKRK